MTVTKVDLQGAKFTKSLFGYRPAEVDSVLSEAAEALGLTAEENRRLTEKIRDMEKAADSLEARESALRQTLAATQKIVEDLKENAREQARLIVEDAKVKAAQVIREAHESVAGVQRDVMDLKHRRIEFEMSLRALLESHLRYLDAGEQDRGLAELGHPLSLGAGDGPAEADGPREAAEPGEADWPDGPDGRD
ncbi:MAG: DivIVA domain-containing protein [Desulfovibrionaceae bacterium]|nr:DivIVA domain-containing protein [Desulfovibrionaceae bacterium]MBF0514724.1 DivIVA domain-containing protein [Desulfovibrionaceae bacterium]